MSRVLPLVQPAPIFSKIAIVGLGQIGGSIALAARRAWPKGLVIGVDTNKVLEQAMVLYAVDVAADDLVIASEAELVILAASDERNLQALDEIPGAIPGSAVVTSGVVVSDELAAAAGRLPPRLTFVCGHPAIEDEDKGILQASADLFKGRKWVLEPAPTTPADVVDRLQRFFDRISQ